MLGKTVNSTSLASYTPIEELARKNDGGFPTKEILNDLAKAAFEGKNRFAGAFVKIGTRTFVDEFEFWQRMREMRGEGR